MGYTVESVTFTPVLPKEKLSSLKAINIVRLKKIIPEIFNDNQAHYYIIFYTYIVG